MGGILSFNALQNKERHANITTCRRATRNTSGRYQRLIYQLHLGGFCAFFELLVFYCFFLIATCNARSLYIMAEHVFHHHDLMNGRTHSLVKPPLVSRQKIPST